MGQSFILPAYTELRRHGIAHEPYNVPAEAVSACVRLRNGSGLEFFIAQDRNSRGRSYVLLERCYKRIYPRHTADIQGT